MGPQRGAGIRRRRPPTEPALREPLVAQPESLPVVQEHLDRGAATVAEDEDRTAHGIRSQHRAARLGQAVDPPAEVRRLHGDQHPRLRRDLDHPV